MQLSHLQLALERFLTARPYHPCCLLVHLDVRRLQAVAEQITIWYRWPMLSIGTEISAALLPVAPTQRSREAHAAVGGAVEQHAPGPVLCADIDLLFEPSLSIDPLRLLRDTSRRATLVVLWPGRYSNGVLSYASTEPHHAHYRAWTQTDLSAESIIPL